MRSGAFGSAAMRLTAGLWAFCVVTFALSMAVSGAGRFPVWMAVWLAAITVSGLVFTALLYGVIRGVRDRPQIERWAILAVAVLVAAMTQSLVDGLLNESCRLIFGLPPRTWLKPGEFAFNGLLYIWLFGFYTATLELIAATEQASHNAHRAAAYAEQIGQERELAHEAQVQMLRFQLDPHFLFNTLNSISSLVVSGRPAQAETMIARLCQFMRAGLHSREQPMIPLRQELIVVEAYLAIEAARFCDALTIEIDCPPSLGDVLVPGMILQPLAEAAVKHALRPSWGAGMIRVHAREAEGLLEVVVSDEGDDRAADGMEATEDDGLQIVRDRLAVVYGDQGWLDVGQAKETFHATMSAPLRRSAILSAA